VKLPETVGIVGLGLVGASLGMALRERIRSIRVIGSDVDPEAVDIARTRGAIDEEAHSLGGLGDADLVIVAVPPAAVVEVARRVSGVMKPGSVLTDVASTKAAIVDELDRVLPTHVHYVGGHPMAGSEGRGAVSADPGLFVGRPFVLTPTARTDRRVVAMMGELIARIGMRSVVLAPLEHDALVAQVSHLPYLVAVAVVNAASEEALSVGGPTLEAFARIASSPVDLWAQIAQANRASIADALERARSELDALERVLADGPALRGRLARASQRSRTVGS